MLTQQPDPRRSGLPFMVRARVSDASFRALALVADARGVPASEIVREFVDRGLAAFVNERGESLLDVVRDDASIGVDQVAVDELREQLAAEGAAVA